VKEKTILENREETTRPVCDECRAYLVDFREESEKKEIEAIWHCPHCNPEYFG
jgi:ribosomal protein L37AE/L43A